MKVKMKLRLREVWSNTAKGPYTWHHTVMMENEHGDLFIWTYTNVNQKHPSEGWFELEAEQVGESKSLKGCILTRITNGKILKGV